MCTHQCLDCFLTSLKCHPLIDYSQYKKLKKILVSLSVGHYFSSKMWAKEREDTTLYIQCRVRAWFARKRAYNLRKLRDDKDAELRRRQEELRIEEENKRKIEIERRMHPKKGKDFDILFNELEAWRLNETKKIKSSNELNHEEKKLAL